VGEYAIALGTLTNTNYSLSLAPENFSITPLAVTVTPDALTKTYGTADPTLTYSLSATSSATLTATGSLTRAVGEDVGEYAIALGTLTNTNYTLSLAPENFSITPLAVTVTPDALTKTYGTADPTLTYSLSATSSASLTATGSLTRAVGEDVGEYAIALGTLTNTNYTLSIVPEYLSIIPLSVTVTPDALTKTYGTADPTFTYTLSATSSATLTATGSLTRASGEDVGEYAIGLGSLSNPNYAFSLTEADFKIEAKTLTVTVLDLEKTYDGEQAAGFEVSYEGFVYGEDERNLSGVLDFSGLGLTAVDVGEYEVVARGWSNVNYQIVYQTGTLTIDPLTVVVLPDRLSKTYGEEDPVFTYTLSAEGVDGLALEVEGSLARELGELVGAYGLSLGTLAEANYSLVLEPVDFEILPATLVVTVADYAHEYDGTSVENFSVRVDGFVGVEDQDVLTGALVFVGEAVGAVAVGNYDITASGWQAHNYLIQYIPGVLTISGVAVTVVPVLGQQKIYGIPDPEITYTLVPSDVGGVPVDVYGALTREIGEQVGEYAILMGSLSSVQATLVLDTTMFAVQPRILDVQVLDDAKLVTTTDVVGYRGVAMEGFAPGEGPEVVAGSLEIVRSNRSVETPGSYPDVLTASGLGADNYQMNYIAGDYTIVPADQLLLVCSPTSWDYGADRAIEVEEAKYLSEIQQEVVVLDDPVYDQQIDRFVFDDGAGGSAVFGLAWKEGLLSSSGALASGIYQAIPTDISVTSDNFSHVITVVGATQVYPKVIALSVAHPQKVYDGTTEIGPLDLSLVGIRPLDEVQLLGSASFEDMHAGNEKSYVIADIGLTGVDAANYALPVWGDWVSDQGVIHPLPVSVTLSGTFSKTYGAEDPLWNWHFFPDEVAGLSLEMEGAPARELGENAGTYSIGLGDLTHPDLVLSLEPQDFVIEPTLLEVNVVGGQKQYDGLPYAELQVEVSGFVLDDDLQDLSGTLVYTGPGVTAVETGTYLVSATGWANPNYLINYRSSEVRIVRSFIQVYPLEGQFFIYGDQEPTWKYRVDPEFMEGKEVILSGQLGREAGDLVGGYTYNLGSLSYSDYALELSPGTMQIMPKPVSVSGVKAVDKVYDGAVSASLDLSQLVWSGLVEEVPGEFSVEGNWLNADAGTAKTVHLDWLFSPWWSERYTLLVPTVLAASIIPAPLEVIPVPHQFKVYGSQEPVWHYVTQPDHVALSGQLSRAEGTQVGLYPFDLGTLTHPNYDLSMGYFTAQIVPAPLEVRAKDGFYAYDGTPFYGDFGFEIMGLLAGDPIPKVEISGSSQGSSGLGSYTLMPSLGTWPNYEVTLIPGILTIGYHPHKVEVSGVLTPNSGTSEAVWTITHIDQYPNNQVRIYNKNQQMVWAQAGYRNTWRGIEMKTYRPLPAAPYYYVVDLGEGIPPIQGWLYLTY
jgi:gliding motility-associated-like protein